MQSNGEKSVGKICQAGTISRKLSPPHHSCIAKQCKGRCGGYTLPFETMIGSSETTREPPLSSFDFSNFIEHHLVQHKTHADQSFLEWLVGFAEGDGTFCSREISLQQPKPFNGETNASTGEEAPAEILLQSTQKPLKRRLLFQLVQKDPKVLHRIRAELGFGAVRQSGNGLATHWRYTVEDRRGLQRIMAILNGNLVLPKRRLNLLNGSMMQGAYSGHPSSLKTPGGWHPSRLAGSPASLTPRVASTRTLQPLPSGPASPTA